VLRQVRGQPDYPPRARTANREGKFEHLPNWAALAPSANRERQKPPPSSRDSASKMPRTIPIARRHGQPARSRRLKPAAQSTGRFHTFAQAITVPRSPLDSSTLKNCSVAPCGRRKPRSTSPMRVTLQKMADGTSFSTGCYSLFAVSEKVKKTRDRPHQSIPHPNVPRSARYSGRIAAGRHGQNEFPSPY